MSYYRTQEHRELRALLINKWKPWEQSTGPKTQEGKSVVSKNAVKNGYRSQNVVGELTEIKKMLSEWREMTKLP